MVKGRGPGAGVRGAGPVPGAPEGWPKAAAGREGAPNPPEEGPEGAPKPPGEGPEGAPKAGPEGWPNSALRLPADAPAAVEGPGAGRGLPNSSWPLIVFPPPNAAKRLEADAVPEEVPGRSLELGIQNSVYC